MAFGDVPCKKPIREIVMCVRKDALKNTCDGFLHNSFRL